MNKRILVLIALPFILFACKESGQEKKETATVQKASSLQTETDKLIQIRHRNQHRKTA